jgi:hypothetical protein
MTDTATRSGGRPPGNSTTYNPIAGDTFPPGTPVCQSQDADGTVLPADASDADTAYVTGIAVGTGVEGGSVHVQSGSPMTLTTAEWDAITGGSGGLTRGAPYYLSTTTGRITTTPPVGSGNFVTPIGIATSATDLVIQLGFPAENP